MKIHIFLISLFILSVLLNYVYFSSNKTSIKIVDDMGIGYNLGKTYNCCSSVDKESILYEQIKTWGTILPTKNMINKIKKYGFKTIRFQIIYTNLTDIINSEWLIRVEEIVNWIIKNGMYCILCINHDKQFWISKGQNSKNKYINFWKQISNQFIDNDEHLIFETLTDIDEDIKDLFLLNFTQSFIDTIRNSDGFNKKRLLIIPEMTTENEINNFYKLDIPQDPSNKTAVSLHYYFPFEILNEEYDTPSLNWFNKFGFLYEAIPSTKWGSENDYKEIMNKMKLLKSLFINKGIPVIFGEIGILSKYNSNISLNREFLYTLFSLTKEINGIMACLWDNSEKISEYNNYYNRETDKWNDEIIRKNIFKISKENELKSSDYYITTNIEVIPSYFNFYYSNISNKKLLKITINAKIFGILGIDCNILITYDNKENKWIDLFVTKKEGKKQYDGTTSFTIDLSSEVLNNEVYIMTLEEDVNKNIFINKVTFEFKEYFPYFDYDSYKNSILKELN